MIHLIRQEMIRLVPLSIMPSAIEAQIGWLNDPEVVRYSEQRHKTHTVESQLDYLRGFIGGPDILNAIINDDENRYIGNITAHIDEHNSVADVGILIGHKASWGKGYGTQAWTMFCDSLFENGIRKIEAGHMSTNKSMSRICEKYGMVQEGKRFLHFEERQYVPLEHMGILSDMVLWGKFSDKKAV